MINIAKKLSFDEKTKVSHALDGDTIAAKLSNLVALYFSNEPESVNIFYKLVINSLSILHPDLF